MLDGESIVGHKVRTTADQSDGVVEALWDVGLDDVTTILHGTTAGTNALIEGRGARTALVTTHGFEDLLEIGRQARPSLYDSFVDRPQVLSPRELRFGYDGDIEAIAGLVEGAGPGAVAVALGALLPGSIRGNGAADRLRDRVDAPISVGALVSPQFREYERIATTVLNAYLTPELAGYLSRLDRRGRGRTASGDDLIGWSAPLRHGIDLRRPHGPFGSCRRGRGRYGSGPGQRPWVDHQLRHGRYLHRCQPRRRPCDPDDESRWGGMGQSCPLDPGADIGAGGGSLSWVDDGGALRVGPTSAGADPGPAAYGRGGVVATVTDANVVLGRIPAIWPWWHGESRYRRRAAALALLGADLDLEIEEVAVGIIDVVDTHMERALRAVSVEEGVDPVIRSLSPSGVRVACTPLVSLDVSASERP